MTQPLDQATRQQMEQDSRRLFRTILFTSIIGDWRRALPPLLVALMSTTTALVIRTPGLLPDEMALSPAILTASAVLALLATIAGVLAASIRSFLPALLLLVACLVLLALDVLGVPSGSFYAFLTVLGAAGLSATIRFAVAK